MQDLCDLGEDVRQEEVTKKTLKQVLWTQLLERVRQLPEAQTDEIPSVCQKKAKTKEKKGVNWEPDDVFQLIQTTLPDATDERIDCEKVVDEKIVPFFQQLAPFIDLIHDHRTRGSHEYPHEEQSVALFVLLHACLHAPCIAQTMSLQYVLL